MYVYNVNMAENDKDRFRTLKVWKDFRAKILKERNQTCELCGIRHTGLHLRKMNVHHLDPYNYQNLDPEKFRLLCFTCHDFTEFMVKRIEGQKFKPSALFPEVYGGMQKFLSSPAKEKGEYLIQGRKHELFST